MMAKFLTLLAIEENGGVGLYDARGKRVANAKNVAGVSFDTAIHDVCEQVQWRTWSNREKAKLNSNRGYHDQSEWEKKANCIYISQRRRAKELRNGSRKGKKSTAPYVYDTTIWHGKKGVKCATKRMLNQANNRAKRAERGWGYWAEAKVKTMRRRLAIDYPEKNTRVNREE